MRLFLRAVLAVVLVAALLHLAISFLGKAQIERVGEGITGTGVEASPVLVFLPNGLARTARIDVRNPEGYAADHAVSLYRVSSRISIASLGQEKVRVDYVRIDTIEVVVEQRTVRANNVMELLAEVRQAVRRARASTETDLLQVDRIEVAGCKVSLRLPFGVRHTRRLSGFELGPRDLGDVSTIAEVAEAILSRLLAVVMGAS